MSEYEEILHEAITAYGAGHFQSCALSFRQAADAALAISDIDRWYTATVWAAESDKQSGNYESAQSLLLDARTQENEDVTEEHGICRRIQFEVLSRWRPKLCELVELLDQLERFVRAGTLGRQDPPYFKGVLASLVGRWHQALRDFEQAYLECEIESNGTVPAYVAMGGFQACLKIGDLRAAEDWVEQVRVRWSSDLYAGQMVATLKTLCWLDLARARNAPVSELKYLLRELESIAQDKEDREVSIGVRTARVRVALLDPASGDPGIPSHTVYRECYNRLPCPLDAHDRYTHALLVLDGRLAALRYSAGLPPIDYEYSNSGRENATGGRQWSSIADPYRDRFMVRCKKARNALRIAYQRAYWLDSLLDCDWRQHDVDLRARSLSDFVCVDDIRDQYVNPVSGANRSEKT